MKKSNTYLADDQINLGDLIKSLWRKKILILSISIICGLLGYLYASFQTQESRVEFSVKKPINEIFEIYSDDKNLNERFINDFTLYFLNIENIQIFIEESKEFDNFKKYLKSKNISASEYFRGKISRVKENNSILPNTYFLNLPKDLDGKTFLNNYAKFIKKKTVLETKKALKLKIENSINILEIAYEKARLINLDNPIQRSINEYILVGRSSDLFYTGTKILSKDINYFKELLKKLEEEQFDFEIIFYKSPFYIIEIKTLKYFALGLVIGLFLSLGIIFFKSILNNSQKKTL